MRLFKKIIILVAVFITLACANKTITIKPPFKDNIKKIVFIGDSITYAGDYVNFVEAYLNIHYPDNKFEFINVGLPSETVSGLSEANHAQGRFPRPDLFTRLARIIDKVKPDLAFTNYGMNDGIFLPLNQQRFSAYKAGINKLHKVLDDAGIEQVHIASPIYDAAKGEDYAEVLHVYADWLLSQQTTQSWQVIDGHWPMQQYLDEQRSKDTAFYLAKDGVHPSSVGHGIIANQILIFLGQRIDQHIEPGEQLMASLPNGTEVLTRVRQQQNMMKDAWLDHIGHTRPNMKKGLPLAEAKQRIKNMQGDGKGKIGNAESDDRELSLIF